MLYLISSDNPDVKYVILGGKTYVVGRRDCDILIPGDATVSRKHAELIVTHPESNLTNVAKLPVLKLKDISKFGTWVNNQRVQGERILQDGDSIYFGSQKSSFMVVYEPLVVTSSCLDSAVKKTTRHHLSLLGGHMITEWQKDCSLLIMSKLSVTIKVICALISQKYVVSPVYLEQYTKYLQGTEEKPDPVRFLPDLAESQLDQESVSFSPDIRRKTLFEGKTFYFMSEKQLKKMSLAIELAGGLPLMMDKGKVDKTILKPGSVVMNCTDTELTQSTDGWVNSVQSLLERHKKHMILDAEIGYSVLYCSTDKHCNPDFILEEDISRLPSQSVSQMEPYVPNTETQSRTQTGTGKRKNADIDSQAVVNETKLGAQTPKATQKQQSSQKEKSPAVPVVKEEILSQPQSAQKKRRRADEQEEEDAVVNSKKVKTEPVTPSKPSASSSDIQSSSSKPANSKTRTAKVNVIEDWDSDDAIDYSSIDLDTPQKTVNQSVTQKSNEKSKDSNKSESKKSRSRSRSRSPAPKKAQVKTEQLTPSSPKRSSRADGSSDKPGTSRQRQSTQGKEEVIDTAYENTENLLKTEEENVRLYDRKPDMTQGSVPAGFLTTRKPIKGQVEKNSEYVVESDLPSRCIQVEEVSLVARHPQRKTTPSGDCPEGFMRWKGKIVQNYKKFKKTSQCGSQGLPNIIGGSDLEVHVAKRSKEIDDWFRESIQVESQHNAEDRRAQELFDFDPNAKRRGR